MSKMFAVAWYEYKMQFYRLPTWGLVGGVTLLSLMDNFPSDGNLSRLEFLNQPAYFVYRVMSLDVLVLLFGLAFILAGRIPADKKTGMKTLLMTLPLEKSQYVLGKLLGGFCYTFSAVCIFLTVNTAAYFFGAPFEVSLRDCLIPLLKAIVIAALPSSLFVSLSSISLGGMMDIRLFYMLAAVVFGFNAAYVSSADPQPFYLITSGNLVRMIWAHPKWPYTDMAGVWANGGFLVGSGIVFAGMLLARRGFWRWE